MKPFSRSAWVASVAVFSITATAVVGSAYSGCALSKLGDSGVTTSNNGGLSGFGAASPDSNALGATLGGGSLTIAALLTGGTLLVRQRWLDRTAASAAVLDAEVDLGLTTETETVLVADPAEIESEVALAYRR